MAMISTDTALKKRRVRPLLQHFNVVVEFEQQRIQSLQLRDNMRCDATAVGQYTQSFLICLEVILAGLCRIMGDCKRRDLDFTDAKRVSIGMEVVKL